jgi:type III pantothenate kinase
VVDAGTAVTVNWVDEGGAFRGGAILPGLRLMGRALYEHTFALPLVETWTATPAVPGGTTVAAIEAGVLYAVTGGVRALTQRLASTVLTAPALYLTGGDAPLLLAGLGDGWEHVPHLTLRGILRSAEALP